MKIANTNSIYRVNYAVISTLHILTHLILTTTIFYVGKLRHQKLSNLLKVTHVLDT